VFFRVLRLRNYDDAQAEGDYGGVRRLEHAEKCIKDVLARILNPEDRLRKLVRDLWIGPFKDDITHGDVLLTDTLVSVVKQFTNLKNFG
jgi:hypothetical protein